MAGLSLNFAWNETAVFVKREAGLLFPVAFLLVALPIAAAMALIPEARPGRMPEGGAWTVLVPLAAFVGMIGNLAISYLALRTGTSVGEALSRGARRFLPLLGATLMVAVALTAVAFLVAMIAAMVIPGLRSTPPTREAAGLFILILCVVLVPIFLYVGARLLPSAPVAAAEQGGPVAILKRSWRLTRPVVWTLLGFLLLSLILAVVIGLAAEAVIGIPIVALVGAPRDLNLSAVLMIVVSAAINTLVTVYLTTMIARIYAQLAGEASVPASGT